MHTHRLHDQLFDFHRFAFEKAGGSCWQMNSHFDTNGSHFKRHFRFWSGTRDKLWTLTLCVICKRWHLDNNFDTCCCWNCLQRMVFLLNWKFGFHSRTFFQFTFWLNSAAVNIFKWRKFSAKFIQNIRNIFDFILALMFKSFPKMFKINYNKWTKQHLTNPLTSTPMIKQRKFVSVKLE